MNRTPSVSARRSWPRRSPGAVYCPSLQGVTAYLRENAQPGDIILTVGAGDIYKAGEALLQNNGTFLKNRRLNSQTLVF